MQETVTSHRQRWRLIERGDAAYFCTPVLRDFLCFIFQTKTCMHQPTPPPIPGRVVVEIRSSKNHEVPKYRKSVTWRGDAQPPSGGRTPPPGADAQPPGADAQPPRGTGPCGGGDKKQQKSRSTGVQNVGDVAGRRTTPQRRTHTPPRGGRTTPRGGRTPPQGHGAVWWWR